MGKPNRSERILKRAKQRLAQETDIVEMIKQVRENKTLIKFMTGLTMRESKLIKEARIIAFASDEESETELERQELEKHQLYQSEVIQK